MNQLHRPSRLRDEDEWRARQGEAEAWAAPPRSARGGRVIALLCPGGYEHAGGIGRVMQQLTQAWANAPGRPETVMIDTRGHGGPAAALAAFLSAILKVIALRLGGRLALLHINLASRGSAARKVVFSALAATLGVPTIVHLHGALFDIFYRELPRPAKAIVRGIFASSARVVVLGEVWRRFVVCELGIPEEKVEVVYNGTASPDPAERWPAISSLRIVFLGRLGARKGLPELLAALASPILRDRDWRATLAGDGDVDHYARESQRLGIAGRIDFPGWVDQPAAQALLRTADILVLPSHQEGLPMSVIEALAHGVAVVTTPVGATAELVEDDISGLLVAPGDAQGLAAALARLIDDPALRRRLAENGHRVFREKLDIDATARRFRQIYAIVNERSGRWSS